MKKILFLEYTFIAAVLVLRIGIMEQDLTDDRLIAIATEAHRSQGRCHDPELRQAFQSLGATPAQIRRALSQSEVSYGDFDTILIRCR